MKQHSTLQSILLHLLPGAVATVVLVLTVPLVTAWGYPYILALYLPMILAVILLELGYLLVQGQKESGDLSLKEVVDYREPVPWWYYVVFPVLIVVWGVVVTGLITPVDNLILSRLFAWAPDWYALRNLLEITDSYPRDTLLVTAICAVLLFSLYHFWTPWQFLSRVVLLAPMVYLVWWKRNITLGIIAHCLLNLIGTTVLFAQLLGQ
jgi:hypothetical protein